MNAACPALAATAGAVARVYRSGKSIREFDFTSTRI